MAYSETARRVENAGYGATWSTIADRYRRYRVYRTTLNELRGLSARELDDLGLNQAMIRSTAYKAAYMD